MSRTPLFRIITRAFRTLRAARQRGIPILEYREAERARRISRRALLEGGAALSGAALLPACSNDPRAVDQPNDRVVVVGGGLAGLHCAYRLRKGGVMATVHDAAKRFGGRVFTDRSTFPDGMHCELGGELIDTGHETMHALAEELGIELLDYDTDDDSLGKIVGWFGGARLDEAAILQDFAPIAEKIDEALAVLTDPDGYITYDDPNGAEELDARSIAAWLDGAGATGPVRNLLEVAYTCEYGLDVDDSSALNLLWLISTDTTSFQIFGDSDERFHTKSGNDTYVSKLVAGLDPAQLELESRLVAISVEPDGAYRLTFEQGASTREERADHVVLALPFSILRDVEGIDGLPPQKLKAVRELGYGKNSKLMCGFGSRPWRDAGSNGETYSDSAYQSTWDTSRLQPGDGGILTNYTGGARAAEIGKKTSDENAASFLDELDQVFPGAKAASSGVSAQFVWPDYELTKGSYSAYRVGQFTSIAGSEIERVDNLHFCGEHTSLDAQGYMEGAALTGAIAADEIFADLDVPPEAVEALSVSRGGSRVRRLARSARLARLR